MTEEFYRLCLNVCHSYFNRYHSSLKNEREDIILETINFIINFVDKDFLNKTEFDSNDVILLNKIATNKICLLVRHSNKNLKIVSTDNDSTDNDNINDFIFSDNENCISYLYCRDLFGLLNNFLKSYDEIDKKLMFLILKGFSIIEISRALKKEFQNLGKD